MDLISLTFALLTLVSGIVAIVAMIVGLAMAPSAEALAFAVERASAPALPRSLPVWAPEAPIASAPALATRSLASAPVRRAGYRGRAPLRALSLAWLADGCDDPAEVGERLCTIGSGPALLVRVRRNHATIQALRRASLYPARMAA
jgi:hypothetical protein